jgi:5-methylcytosine-specific restriction protein A
MNKKLRRKRQNRVYGSAWRRVRPMVLARDGGLCQLRLEGCTAIATEVDHIVPVDAGGALYDMDNLRSSCTHCNRRRENLRRQRIKPRASQDWPR